MDNRQCTQCAVPSRLQKLEVEREELWRFDGFEEDGCRQEFGNGGCSGLVRQCVHDLDIITFIQLMNWSAVASLFELTVL